jgi:hypothetical protein
LVMAAIASLVSLVRSLNCLSGIGLLTAIASMGVTAIGSSLYLLLWKTIFAACLVKACGL